MTDRFDDAARRLASASQTHGAGEGLSRRGLIKRAGLVGAVAWTAPMITSVTAPAFAQSACIPSDTSGCGGTCSTKCTNGLVCAADGHCTSGCCSPTGRCGIVYGLTCTGATTAAKDASCCSGKCGAGGTCLRRLNESCGNANECASGVCAKLTPAAAGKTCNAA